MSFQTRIPGVLRPPTRAEILAEVRSRLAGFKFRQKAREEKRQRKLRTCRVCGCTDKDCRQCIEKTGHPCYWVDATLCSACAPPRGVS